MNTLYGYRTGEFLYLMEQDIADLFSQVPDRGLGMSRVFMPFFDDLTPEQQARVVKITIPEAGSVSATRPVIEYR